MSQRPHRCRGPFHQSSSLGVVGILGGVTAREGLSVCCGPPGGSNLVPQTHFLQSPERLWPWILNSDHCLAATFRADRGLKAQTLALGYHPGGFTQRLITPGQ